MTQASNAPLLKALRSRSQQLANQADRLIQESHRFLEYTVSTFPSGTDHTTRHTTTLEAIGRMMLSDAFLAALSDEELFFLTVACHYHDLALAGKEADDRSPETREQVRRDHAIRIGVKIQEKWAELGFEDQRTAQVLGEVCRGHRPKKNSEGEANWDELNSVEVIGPGVSVRVRLLSALTRHSRIQKVMQTASSHFRSKKRGQGTILTAIVPFYEESAVKSKAQFV